MFLHNILSQTASCESQYSTGGFSSVGDQPSLFDELASDPVTGAFGHACWWLVNRIRTRADADEVLRIARECANSGVASSSERARRSVRTSFDLIADAVVAWDDDVEAGAERLHAWETLEATLVSVASRPLHPERLRCIHTARLFVLALREAYSVQKLGNAAMRRLGRPAQRADPLLSAGPASGPDTC